MLCMLIFTWTANESEIVPGFSTPVALTRSPFVTEQDVRILKHFTWNDYDLSFCRLIRFAHPIPNFLH